MSESDPETDLETALPNIANGLTKPEGDDGQPSKFRFTISSLMFLTALCAIGANWPKLIGFATPLIPLIVIGLGSKFRLDWNRYLMVLGAIYLPALQGFVDKGSHCRKVWPELFTIAPTFMPSMFFARGVMFRNDDWAIGIAGIVLASLICGFYLLGPTKKLPLAAVLVLVAMASSISINFLIMMLHI